jgi:hypothetical protein
LGVEPAFNLLDREGGGGCNFVGTTRYSPPPAAASTETRTRAASNVAGMYTVYLCPGLPN